jgi:DNA sulfur modification protein DndD
VSGNFSHFMPTVAEQVILIVMEKDWKYAYKSMDGKVGKAYIIEKVNNSDSNSIIRRGEIDV